jgi:hypothetical protein
MTSTVPISVPRSGTARTAASAQLWQAIGKSSWFPELRTIQLLEQLYARLYELHLKSLEVVQCWLDWRADMADTAPEIPAFQGVDDA